jgi:AcrR family transcriptional regulator
MNASDTTVVPSRSSRGRRAARISSDEREAAILRTAEQLLQERSLADISVDDLAAGAGISRPAFYFYFPSKDAVVLTLVDRLVEGANEAKEGTLDESVADPASAWRQVIQIFYDVLGAHRAVIRAAMELSATNNEARELRSQVTEGWVQGVTERIEEERKRGAAKSGLPARDLATALVQMNESAMLAVFAEASPAVSEDRLVDVLCEIWLNAIYGVTPLA